MYSSYGMSSSAMGLTTVFFIVIPIVVLLVWIMIIDKFIKLAKKKDPSIKTTGDLWVMGFFASPITLGIYVLCLGSGSQNGLPEKDPTTELPSV